MQCASYCEINKCELDARRTIYADEMYQKVMVIDTSYVYLYKHKDESFVPLKALDDFSCKEDIVEFGEKLKQELTLDAKV